MSASPLDELETFLVTQGIVCEQLGQEDWNVIVRQWLSVFGNAFGHRMWHRRYKEGVKAQIGLSQVGKGDFLLFSIGNSRQFPLWRTSEQRPHWGFRCKTSAVPGLDRFCNLDFVMVASDFSWTMVYTHEDFVLGGPYFMEGAWVGRPSVEGNLTNRRGRPRRHPS